MIPVDDEPVAFGVLSAGSAWIAQGRWGERFIELTGDCFALDGLELRTAEAIPPARLS